MGNAPLLCFTSQWIFMILVKLKRLRKDGEGLGVVVKLMKGLYPTDRVLVRRIQGPWWDSRQARYQSQADYKQS